MAFYNIDKTQLAEYKFYKLTNRQECHHGHQYKNGLNELQTTFHEPKLVDEQRGLYDDTDPQNGLYFGTQEFIYSWIDDDHYFIRLVSLPLKDKTLHIHAFWVNGNLIKLRANKFYLGPAVPVWSVRGLKLLPEYRQKIDILDMERVPKWKPHVVLRALQYHPLAFLCMAVRELGLKLPDLKSVSIVTWAYCTLDVDRIEWLITQGLARPHWPHVAPHVLQYAPFKKIAWLCHQGMPLDNVDPVVLENALMRRSRDEVKGLYELGLVSRQI